MFHSIVVPLDGSEIGEMAITPALALAHRHRASLDIVRVYVPVAGVYGERGASYDPVLDRTLMLRAESYLQQVARRAKAAVDVTVTSRLLEGPIAETIERYAHSVKADLMVMTTRGRSPFSRFWLGSVADALARQSTLPILFIHPDENAPASISEGRFHHVLIPLDGSPLAEQAIDHALTINADAQTQYTLLQVIPTLLPITTFMTSTDMRAAPEPFYPALQDWHKQIKTSAETYLARMAETLRAKGMNVQTHVTANDLPAAAILEEATNRQADLIALSSRGQGGIKRMLLGSVADKVLRGSVTSVLVCPPGQSKDDASHAPHATR